MITLQDENLHSTNWFTMSEVAKALALKDTKGRLVGRNKLFRLFYNNKILFTNGYAYQYYLSLDLIRMHKVMKHGRTYFHPIVSESGLNYFKNRFASGIFEIALKEESENIIQNIDDIL